MTGLEILFVAELVPGSRSWQRVAAFERLGHRVTTLSLVPADASYERKPGLVERVRHRLRLPADQVGANRQIIELAETHPFDVAWFERATTVTGATLQRLKDIRPDCRRIWYAEDDMMNPAHQSRQVAGAIPHYDLWSTTKSFNARPQEIPALGARNLLFVNNAYDRDAHGPIDMDDAARKAFGADISFVGTFERPRAETLRRLADAGLHVRVWGNGWERMEAPPPGLDIAFRPVYGDDYRRVVTASAINLCFLRKGNRDLQTCRSFEIPAIGGFMLHETSPEMEAILAPDREACYFANDAELPEICRSLIADDERRIKIAAAGHARLTNGANEHADRLRQILEAARAGNPA
jgi:hypothetical protein